MLTKKVKIDPDALPVLENISWEERQDGSVIGRIEQQLDRDLYTKVNKALITMGGKWDKRKEIRGHIFATDPRPGLVELFTSAESNGGKPFIAVEKDGHFPTPHDLGVRMALLAELQPTHKVLEPSAGTGELVLAIQEVLPQSDIFCIEKNPDRCKIMGEKGIRLVHCGDFLAKSGEWDRIIQNPPFENGQDIDHIYHAYDSLVPGGILVSVCSESPFFREAHKYQEFCQWLDVVDAKIWKLPPGTFSESGTSVGARLIKIVKKTEPE